MFRTDHHPWPLPRRPWLLHMTWRRLLFIHYPIDPAAMRAALPAGLIPDTFDGSAWLGIVPFVMHDTRLRWTPRPLAFAPFPELNVRTYITVDGKPGVFFFSLDCAHRLTVEAARMGFALPYFHARMSAQPDPRHPDATHYRSQRTDRRAGPAIFDARYGPRDANVFHAQPGSLDHFLVERYCLYTADRRDGIWRGDIHHDPWPLRRAWLNVHEPVQRMIQHPTLPDVTPVLHYAQELRVRAWPPSRARA